MTPSSMRSDESLGRRVSEKQAQKPKRYKRIRENIRARDERKIPKQVIPTREFRPKRGETKLSVDRVDEAPREAVAAVAERDAREAEDGERIFYGWAVVPCERAMRDGREVRATPIKRPPNPFHADIVFPDSVKDKEDARNHHALQLAENAKWLEWREREKSRPNFRVV